MSIKFDDRIRDWQKCEKIDATKDQKRGMYNDYLYEIRQIQKIALPEEFEGLQ